MSRAVFGCQENGDTRPVARCRACSTARGRSMRCQQSWLMSFGITRSALWHRPKSFLKTVGRHQLPGLGSVGQRHPARLIGHAAPGYGIGTRSGGYVVQRVPLADPDGRDGAGSVYSILTDVGEWNWPRRRLPGADLSVRRGGGRRRRRKRHRGGVFLRHGLRELLGVAIGARARMGWAGPMQAPPI